jgi:fructose-1,6-bisphosphatase/inositol monophosphatase family enzyme
MINLDTLDDQVRGLLRDASDRLVLPRWQSLDPSEISEKKPGDLVTVVDHAVEAYLEAALPKLVPGSLIVGEEAVAANPSVLGALASERPVWVVDPIDGTGNFARGQPTFAIMVALVQRDEVLTSWIARPAKGDIYHARRGEGAWRAEGNWAQSQAIKAPHPPVLSECISGVYTGFLTPEWKQRILPGIQSFKKNFVYFCAGFEYAALALGDKHVALAFRVLPWDHAPGALIAEEAGCFIADFQGQRYRPSAPAPGLFSAATAELWQAAHQALNLGS